MRHLRRRQRGDDDRRRVGQRRRADRVLHRGGTGQHRLARRRPRGRRPGRDGRVPLLRRRPARVGVAVPLLTLPQAQFLLMSATLGDVTRIATDLTRRTGRETAVIDDAARPVPLTYAWSVEPLHELLEELSAADRAPIYVVHFTQASATERAQALLSARSEE